MWPLLSHKDKLHWLQMLLSSMLFWKLQWTLEVHKGHSLVWEGNPLSEALTKTMTGSLSYFKQTSLWFKLYFKKCTFLNLWVLLFWNNTSCHFIRGITENIIWLFYTIILVTWRNLKMQMNIIYWVFIRKPVHFHAFWKHLQKF